MSAVPPLVVDTSVAVKWFFEEPHTPEASSVLDALRAGAYRAVVPDLIYAEFANAVWKRVVREGLDTEEGAIAVATFERLPLESVASPPLLLAAYRLAVEHRRTVYDGLFLALSGLAEAELVTADEALYRAVHPRLARVLWLGEWRP